MATVWFVCRFAKNKQRLNVIYICQAVLSLVGVYFGAHVLECISRMESIPEEARVPLGLMILLLSYIFPAACSILTTKYAFPQKWQQYWKIRNAFLGKGLR